MRRNSAFPFLAPTVVLRVCGGRTSASNTLLVWLKHRADNNKHNIKTRATTLDGSVNMFQAGVTKFLPGISDLQKKGKLELDYLMTLIFRSMMSMWCGFNFSSWEFKSLHHKEPRIKGTRQMDANNCKMKLDLRQKKCYALATLALIFGSDRSADKYTLVMDVLLFLQLLSTATTVYCWEQVVTLTKLASRHAYLDKE